MPGYAHEKPQSVSFKCKVLSLVGKQRNYSDVAKIYSKKGSPCIHEKGEGVVLGFAVELQMMKVDGHGM